MKKDGPYVAPAERFNNVEPDFFGKGEDATPNTSNSTNGLYNMRQGPDALDKSEANANKRFWC